MQLILARVLVLTGLGVCASVSYAGSSKPTRNDCDRASERVFGRLPARFVENKATVSEPKSVRRVDPKLPSKWPQECKGTVSIHEALIAPTGKVARVFRIKSPCAESDRLVSNAIAQWEYTPTLVEGTAVPACLTVTTLVHLR